MIDDIGQSANSMFQGSEPAITIIPNFMATGIIAIFVSFLVIIWAVFFIDMKNGGLILLLLSILQLLVGGGIAPLTIAITIIAGIVATRINKPLKCWRVHSSSRLQQLLVKLWPWILIDFFI